jgi:hypothetical protein
MRASATLEEFLIPEGLSFIIVTRMGSRKGGQSNTSPGSEFKDRRHIEIC